MALVRVEAKSLTRNAEVVTREATGSDIKVFEFRGNRLGEPFGNLNHALETIDISNLTSGPKEIVPSDLGFRIDIARKDVCEL